MVSLLLLLAGLAVGAERGVDVPALPPAAPLTAFDARLHVQSLARAAMTLDPRLSAPAAQALAAEALARPALLPALPGGPALAARVEAAHASPAARAQLLDALAPLRAPALRDFEKDGLTGWARAFDGGRDAYPVLETNFPGMLYGYGDPAALRTRRGYYVVATSDNAPDVGPIVRSPDLAGWRPAGFVFPKGQKPAWHDQDPERYDFWAPEIHRVGKRYVVYYTARDTTGRLSIGAASSKSPTGPWTDLGRPLIRDERVGMIDSHHFYDRASGKHYLFWKKDGNDLRPKEKTTVYVSELSPDGLSLAGPKHEILENDQPWEDDLIEGPWMVKRGGWYYLFFSGNNYATDRYGMSVARARSPFGPFQKSSARLLMSGALFEGPGHCSVVKGPNGEDLLVYHGYRPGKAGYRKNRLMRIEALSWKGGWPSLARGFAGGAPPLP